jgi:hypothetical protein
LYQRADTGLGGIERHDLTPIGTGIHVAMLAGLIAQLADIHL